MAETKPFQVKLIPFCSESITQGLSLEAAVEFYSQTLILEYELTGKVDEVLIPSREGICQRLDRLWEHTCFEAFWSFEEGPESSYWELNLAPSGHWNLYHFDRYRMGHKLELRIDSMRSEIMESGPNSFKIRAWVDLSSLIPQGANFPVFLGLTSVIENKDLKKTYWAIQHLGPEPDFHLRSSFLVRIEQGRITRS